MFIIAHLYSRLVGVFKFKLQKYFCRFFSFGNFIYVHNTFRLFSTICSSISLLFPTSPHPSLTNDTPSLVQVYAGNQNYKTINVMPVSCSVPSSLWILSLAFNSYILSALSFTMFPDLSRR